MFYTASPIIIKCSRVRNHLSPYFIFSFIEKKKRKLEKEKKRKEKVILIVCSALHPYM